MATQLNNVYLRSAGKLSLALGTDPTRVYGSTEADVITIAAGVVVQLDGSFGRGNDIIRFTGNAASYSVVRVNASTVRITDALGTSVTIPVGSAGTTIEFADATRTLSGSQSGILLGNQTVTATATALPAGTAVEGFVLTTSAPTVTEGDNGTKTLTYVLTLDKAPTSPVTVNYQTTDAGTAAAGDDFQVVAGQVTFAPDQTAATVSVTVYGDTVVEADETVVLRLSGSKLVAAVDAVGTIRSDDSAPVDPSSYTVTAGDIATANAAGVPVTLNIGNTGNKTVTVQSDGASVGEGIIINGNANATVTAGAAGDKIIVSGNGNYTINAGGGNDNVSVYGSGTNTINVGTGNDTVLGGTGDDTIIFGSGNFNGADEVNGGAGFDTVVISGEGNVVDAGNLVGVEKLVFNGTVAEIPASVLLEYLANGLQFIQGSPQTTVINITGLSNLPSGTLNLSGIQFIGGINQITSNSSGTIILNTTQSQQIGEIVPTSNAVTVNQQIVVTGPQTVAQAEALIASGETAKFAVVDTAANLALASSAVYSQAVSIEATTDLSAAQAHRLRSQIGQSNNTSIFANGAVVDAAIKVNVTDTASMLANNPNGLAIADKVTATTAATVAEAKAINNANTFVAGVPLFTASYSVEDTATALDAADIGTRSLTTTLNSPTVTTTSTAGFAVGMGVTGIDIPAGAKILSITNGTTFTISANATATGTDAGGQIVGSSAGAALNGAESVKISGSATVAQVAAINADLAALTGGPAKVVSGYDLVIAGVSDVNDAAEIAIANAARNITVVSGGNVVALSVADATAIDLLSNSGRNTYALKDTALALRNASSAVKSVGVLNGVTVDPAADDGDSNSAIATVSVTALNQLIADFGPASLNMSAIRVADTAAELVKLSPAAMAALGAGAITTVIGTATVAQLNALNTFLTDPQTGTFSAKIAGSATVAVKDTAANLVAATKDPASLAAIDDGASALVGASSVEVSDTATVAQIAAINMALTAAAGARTEVATGYTLQDTAAKLTAVGAIGSGGIIDDSGKVIVSGPASISDINTIKTAFGGSPVLGTNIVYALSDSVTGLTTGSNAAIVNAATALTLANKNVVVTDGTALTNFNALNMPANYPKFDGEFAIEADVTQLVGINATALARADGKVTLVDDLSNLFSGSQPVAAQALADKVIATVTVTGAANDAAENTAITNAVNSPNAGKVDGFRIVGAVDTANLAAVNALSAIKPTEYSIVGNTYAQLMASGTALATFVQKAAAITVTGAPDGTDTFAELTVEQFNALDARANGSIVFDLQDTAANLASTNASAAVAAVASAKLAGNTDAGITVTSTLPGDNFATVAEAKVLIARGIGGFVINDTAENISAAGDLVLGDSKVAAIIINDGGEATLSVASALRVFDNGATTPDGSAAAKYNIVDTAANLAAAEAELLRFAQNVTATTVADGSQAASLTTKLPFGTITYDVADQASALLSGGNANAAANYARNVTIVVTDPVSVAEAVALQKATNSGSLSYRIEDTAASLALSLVAPPGETAANAKIRTDKIAAIEAATGIVVVNNGADANANAAQATLISALNKPVVYDLADTAAEISTTVSTAALNEAKNITVSSGAAVTASVAAKLLGATNSGTTTIAEVSATAAEAVSLTLTSNDVITSLTVTGVTSAADARAIFAKDAGPNIGTITFATISDTASALAAAAAVPGLLARGTAVVATTAATVAEATKIHTANTGAVFDIADTYANLMENSDVTGAVDAAAVIVAGRKITITDDIRIFQALEMVNSGLAANADQVFEQADVYRIVDADDNILFWMGNADGAAMLFKAASVTGSNGVSLKFDHIGTPGASTLHIVGTRAEIEALPASFAAAKKLIEVSVADLVANSAYYTTLPGNVGYRVVDTYANLTSGNTLIGQAKGITVVGNLTMAEAAVARDLIADETEVSYSLQDTSANLVVGSSFALNSGVPTATVGDVLEGASNVVATTPVTVGNAAILRAAVGSAGKATYSITEADTATTLIAANTAIFSGATDITVTSTANGSINRTQAEVLLAAKNTGATVIAHVGGSISDMQGLLLAKGANDTITKVTVSAPNTVAEVNSIAGLASSTVYSLVDKAANLVAAGSTMLNGATAISLASGEKATVEQLIVLDAATPPVTASISDTAENILNASPALLEAYDATPIAVKGSISAATAAQLQNFEDVNLLNIDVQAATLADTSANLLLIANAGVVGAATKVTVTDTMTAERAALVVAKVNTGAGGDTALTNSALVYNLSDTYGNLATRSATANLATNITITNTIGASQAKTADDWTNAGTVSYSVRDTAANVANATFAVALAKAGSVTLTDAATVAQAARISEMANVATYAIKDDAADVYAALNTANGLNALDRETVLGAATITLNTKANVDQAVGVAGSGGNNETLGLGTIPGLAFKVSDTAENIAAALRDPAKASILLNATTVELTDGSAATLADLSLIADILGSAFLYDVVDPTAGTSEYRITDTFTNIQLGDPSLVLGAAALVAKGTDAADVIDMGVFSKDLVIDLTETTPVADVVVLNSVVGTSSDSGRVTVTGNDNDTGQDTIDDFDFGTGADTIRIVASNVSGFEHGTDTTIGTATGLKNDGTVGSFTAATGLIELNQTADGDWDDAGDIAVTFTSQNGTYNENNFEAALQYDLTGTDAANTITGGGLADTIRGGGGADVLTGGTGADVLTGGTGADTFRFAAGDTGTPSATNFDVITDFATASDVIDFSVAVTIGANANAATVGAAAISADGLATFAGADDTLGEMITAVAGGISVGGSSAGEAAIFVNSGDTYIFISDGSDGVTAADVLIQLDGVSGTSFDQILLNSGNFTLG